MNELKLLALDEEDLDIISAHMQDAVFKAADIEFDQKYGLFSVKTNRFAWEKAAEKGKSYERRRTLLTFKRVNAVQSLGVNRKNGDAVLDLLAIQFEKMAEGPEGTIELLLAGDGAIRLNVECIEVQLADAGGAWETLSRPQHMTGA